MHDGKVEVAGTMDPASPSLRSGQLLLSVAQLLARLETDRLAELDPPLTPRQYRFLWRLANGFQSPSAIKPFATISVAAISQSLDILVKRGLAQRHADPQDRRRVILATTPDGDRALEAAERQLANLSHELLVGLDAETVRVFAEMATELRERTRALLRGEAPPTEPRQPLRAPPEDLLEGT